MICPIPPVCPVHTFWTLVQLSWVHNSLSEGHSKLKLKFKVASQYFLCYFQQLRNIFSDTRPNTGVMSLCSSTLSSEQIFYTYIALYMVSVISITPCQMNWSWMANKGKLSCFLNTLHYIYTQGQQYGKISNLHYSILIQIC